MEKVPSWMERLLLPKLNEITGELKAIHTRIDAVEKEIVSLRNETIAKFEATDAKVESLRKETKMEIASLRNEMLAKFEATDAKLESLGKETKSDIASLSKETKGDIAPVLFPVSIASSSFSFISIGAKWKYNSNLCVPSPVNISLIIHYFSSLLKYISLL